MLTRLTVFTRAALLALVVATACSSTEPDLTAAGATRVVVINDGSVPFTDVRITTSESDALPSIATLNPGQMSGPHPVNVLHANPLVQANAQGRAITAHPVEGFSGFNPALAEGVYAVKLRMTDGVLDVRVGPMP